MALTLSVLIPAYNAGVHLVPAVESMLSQGVSDLEVVVIDDGSTDGSMDELAGVDDPRIRVVHQENRGLVSALNRGLDECRGEFIARMDADDVSAPGRLVAQMRWMAEHPDGVLCGTDYELFGSMTGRVRMPRTDRDCRQRLLLASAFCGASVMLRRSVIERAGLRFDPEFTHAEDYEFFTRLVEYGEAGNLDTVGYRYRIHDGQVSDVHESVQRTVHMRIAERYARTADVVPLDGEIIADLLWPDYDGTRGPRRSAPRVLAGTVGAAVAAVRRSPSRETVRFSGRKIVEASFGTLHSLRTR